MRNSNLQNTFLALVVLISMPSPSSACGGIHTEEYSLGTTKIVLSPQLIYLPPTMAHSLKEKKAIFFLGGRELAFECSEDFCQADIPVIQRGKQVQVAFVYNSKVKAAAEVRLPRQTRGGCGDGKPAECIFDKMKCKEDPVTPPTVGSGRS